MTLYVGSNKIKDVSTHGVYVGSQNTNCLTYVPKNINLTLSNGTLTLKAGSKVYNGDGTFYTNTSDVSHTPSWGTLAGLFVFPVISGSSIVGFDAINPILVFSGNTAPTFSGNYAYWFDTTIKKVKYTNDAGVTWVENRAFPLCLVTVTNGTVTSIDQIFDWCGFIGSHQFFLPGIKGLKSNGFKADGTYNNIEVETKSVILNQYTYKATNQQVFIENNGKCFIRTAAYYNQASAPAVRTDAFWHNTKDNFNYYIGADTSTGWVKNTTIDFPAITNISTDSSYKVTSMTPATVQPSTTTIPINAIYNGSDLVYQYIPAGKTFNAATYFQTYVVPKGIKKLQVDCVAARGYNGRTAGKGGRVTCILAVTPGQTLYLWVPIDPTTSDGYVYNAADIRTIGGSDIYNADSLNSRLVVAGGGGYSSNEASYGGVGGAGGGLTGAAGGDATYYGGAGGGGTQTAGGYAGGTGGGIGGWSGVAGTFGKGGVSNDWKQSGGSGWYGGGGGGTSAYYGDGRGGGGGGSSYTNPSLCSNVNHTQGYRDGAGYITITPTK